MVFSSNFITAQKDRYRDKQVQRDQQKLLQAQQQGLANQTASTGKFLQLAFQQKTALAVASEQARPIVQDYFQRFGSSSNPAVGAPAKPITPQQKIDMGTQALKSTPLFASAYYQSTRAEHQLNQASALEDKILKTKAQQALETDRNVKVVGGEKFYDAFQSPEEMKTAYTAYSPEKLLKPEYGNHLLHSPRFQDTLEQRYGTNPFQPNGTKVPSFLGGKPTLPPQPIGYHSSKGWIYDDKTMAYLQNKDRPEDLSWIPAVQDRAIGNEQVASLQRPLI